MLDLTTSTIKIYKRTGKNHCNVIKRQRSLYILFLHLYGLSEHFVGCLLRLFDCKHKCSFHSSRGYLLRLNRACWDIWLWQDMVSPMRSVYPMTHFPESSYSWSLLLICLLLTTVCVIFVPKLPG